MALNNFLDVLVFFFPLSPMPIFLVLGIGSCPIPGMTEISNDNFIDVAIKLVGFFNSTLLLYSFISISKEQNYPVIPNFSCYFTPSLPSRLTYVATRADMSIWISDKAERACVFKHRALSEYQYGNHWF